MDDLYKAVIESKEAIGSVFGDNQIKDIMLGLISLSKKATKAERPELASLLLALVVIVSHEQATKDILDEAEDIIKSLVVTALATGVEADEVDIDTLNEAIFSYFPADRAIKVSDTLSERFPNLRSKK